MKKTTFKIHRTPNFLTNRDEIRLEPLTSEQALLLREEDEYITGELDGGTRHSGVTHDGLISEKKMPDL